LGGTVPDGFFFDFNDITDPQFYIVEVELAGHEFFNHIFPQVTKFFAFFKNNKLQKSLVDKIFSVINTDDSLKNEFRKYLGTQEIYKFLSDIIESNPNILLVADGALSELPEIMDTYTDTWGKMVKYLVVKRYSNEDDVIYSITPDFETLQYFEGGEEIETSEDESESPKYSEEFHLEGVNPVVKEIYAKIKEFALARDTTLVFNPQKYYVSIKANKNIAFLKISNKKIRFIAMMPESEIRKYVVKYPVAPLSEPVQRFYNGPCAGVDIANLSYVSELENLIRQTINFNQ